MDVTGQVVLILTIIFYVMGLLASWLYLSLEVYDYIKEFHISDKEFWLMLGKGIIWPYLAGVWLCKRLIRFLGPRA